MIPIADQPNIYKIFVKNLKGGRYVMKPRYAKGLFLPLATIENIFGISMPVPCGYSHVMFRDKFLMFVDKDTNRVMVSLWKYYHKTATGQLQIPLTKAKESIHPPKGYILYDN